MVIKQQDFYFLVNRVRGDFAVVTLFKISSTYYCKSIKLEELLYSSNNFEMLTTALEPVGYGIQVIATITKYLCYGCVIGGENLQMTLELSN